MMLMCTFFTVAKTNEKVAFIPESSHQTTMIPNNGTPVPIWEVGDSWNYKINTIVIDLNMSGFLVHIVLWTDNISLKVVDDTGDSYIIQINATINGNGYVYMDFGDGPINITGELQETTISGTIDYNKSDLRIKHIDVTLDGNLQIHIIENPYIPIEKPIHFPVTINVLIDTSVFYPIIVFPLNVSDIWGLPATNISFDGSIQSPWLNSVDGLNNFAQDHWLIVEIIVWIWNKIPGLPPINPDLLKNISDILADILPIIDISDVLTEYIEIEPIIGFPAVPDIFICTNTENITIGNHTFFVYNISVGGGLGSMYYAPEAGTIVKIIGRFKDILPFISNLDAELIDYSYS